jgi:putative transposase
MRAERKREVIELVRKSPWPKRRTLAELGISRSTYYRWQRRYFEQGESSLLDRKPRPGRVWNRLRPEEERRIVTEGLRQPDWSSRELACWLTDHGGFSVSESTVYRVLKRHGLIREVELKGFPAGQEYRYKPQRVNEQWQSDASYFFVVGWGWYYLISVLDDYSRYILAWDLKSDMTAQSMSEVVQEAVEWTGMERVPVTDRSKLLTDRAHLLLAASPADQREDRAVSRDAQTASQPAGLHDSWQSAPGHGRFHRFLQPPAIPRGNRERGAGGCLLRSAGSDSRAKEGFEKGHNRGAMSVQSRSDNRRARDPSVASWTSQLISKVLKTDTL